MTNVAILISGGGSNMLRLVEEMHTGKIKAIPALVLSDKADAGGLSKAQCLGVPTVVVSKSDCADAAEFNAKIDQALRNHKIDIVCLAGFMRILSAELTSTWAGKMLNIHPSLLPKYKGLHTHQRAIDAGDTVAGCTVHIVTPELDAGPILGQARVPILPDDTSETLAARVLVEEHRLYPKVLAEFLEAR
ncbi:MAG: phosphoribosylglycinamide formyltransferase [Pseudomonadota bacterium]